MRKRGYYTWTKEEEEYVRQFYQIRSSGWIALKIGKDPKAVSAYISNVLKLRKQA